MIECLTKSLQFLYNFYFYITCITLQPIFGHNGIENLTYKSVPFRDGIKTTYLDEKDVNLRETAFETTYPSESGETTVKCIYLYFKLLYRGYSHSRCWPFFLYHCTVIHFQQSCFRMFIFQFYLFIIFISFQLPGFSLFLEYSLLED